MRHLPTVLSVSRSQRFAGQAKATPSRRGRLQMFLSDSETFLSDAENGPSVSEHVLDDSHCFPDDMDRSQGHAESNFRHANHNLSMK